MCDLGHKAFKHIEFSASTYDYVHEIECQGMLHKKSEVVILELWLTKFHGQSMINSGMCKP